MLSVAIGVLTALCACSILTRNPTNVGLCACALALVFAFCYMRNTQAPSAFASAKRTTHADQRAKKKKAEVVEDATSLASEEKAASDADDVHEGEDDDPKPQQFLDAQRAEREKRIFRPNVPTPITIEKHKRLLDAYHDDLLKTSDKGDPHLPRDGSS